MSVFRRSRPDASTTADANAAAESGAKYRSVVENAVAGVFQTSPDGRYLTANLALARIYGYPTVEALTAEIIDIAEQLYVEPNRRAEFQRLLLSQDVVEGFGSETRRIGGTGLGRALVKEIADAHGGRVWVESALGEGSTFYLALPRADAASETVAPTAPDEAPVAARA